VEINQAKPVPQTASTGSTGASASALGSEAGSDGFLSLMNCFMGDGSAEEIDAPDQGNAAGQGAQTTSAIPDGLLSLIAPGLFSNMILQPQQPASGDAAAGAEVTTDLAAAAPAGEAAAGPLQAPAGSLPDLPAKGLAPLPPEGAPTADGDELATDGDETLQSATPQLSEEELAKLVAEGKATKEIASILNVSVKTVEFHKTRIMKELRLRTAAELTKYAIAAGLTSIH